MRIRIRDAFLVWSDILVSTIIGWNVFLDWLAFRFPRVRALVEPRPLPLVENGRMNRRNMREEFLSEDELMAKLRELGIDTLMTSSGPRWKLTASSRCPTAVPRQPGAGDRGVARLRGCCAPRKCVSDPVSDAPYSDANSHSRRSYSPAVAFCAASAISTCSRTSAMPIAPTFLRSNTWNRTKMNQ